MKTNALPQSNELISILNGHFEGVLHLARVKCMAMIIVAMCKVQTVNLEKLAHAFDTKAKSASSFRRIQRFIGNFALDRDLIAKLIFRLLPNQQQVKLSIDRTNWQFGKVDINIFMLGVVHQGVAFPLLFTMLPKKGNSSTKERIALLQRFIDLFGKDCIESLVADREFVGEHWLDYLKQQGICYHIRVRNNFKVSLPHKLQTLKVTRLFSDLKVGQFKHYNKKVLINGQVCYLSGSRCKGDYLIIMSFDNPAESQRRYAERWQIEMSFKAMKTSGFDIEKTHLQEIERIERLVLLVSIAFVWCYKVGLYFHSNVKPIPIKKHGRRAKSIFKYGLNQIASQLLNPLNEQNVNVFKFLSCT